MNTLLKIAIGLLASLTLGPATLAENYPSKPIRIIVPFPPGGPTDVISRIMAQKLVEAWGQQVLVENRPGANTIIGAEAVARAAPDGYTLLMAIDSTLTMNQSLYNKLPYDPLRDFAPITLTVWSHVIFVTDAVTGPKTLSELVQLARAHPGKVNFGAGTIATQLIGERFKRMLGLDIVFVPYKGSAGTLHGLLAGDVTFTVDDVTASLPHIKSGKLRVLATAGTRPIPGLSDVPTVAAAANLPGFDLGVWQGLVAPAKTPLPILDKLHQEAVRILNEPDVKERFLAVGLEALSSTPGEFAAHIYREAERWGKLIQEAGSKLD